MLHELSFLSLQAAIYACLPVACALLVLPLLLDIPQLLFENEALEASHRDDIVEQWTTQLKDSIFC